MALRSSPKNQEQRDQVAWSAAEFRQRNTNEQANMVFDQVFAPALADWKQKRDALYAARSKETAAHEARLKADALMDKQARRWMATLVDDDGYSMALQLKPFLSGRTLVQVLKLKPIRQVEAARLMFVQVDASPHLQGDATKLAAFKAATEGLAECASIEHNCERTVREATAASQAAEKVFDKAYANFRKVAQVLLGNEILNHSFPRFAMLKADNKEEAVSATEEAFDTEKAEENA